MPNNSPNHAWPACQIVVAMPPLLQVRPDPFHFLAQLTASSAAGILEEANHGVAGCMIYSWHGLGLRTCHKPLAYLRLALELLPIGSEELRLLA